MSESTSTDPAEGFQARIQELRVPEPKADRERQLLWLGTALAVVGVLAILFAWYQASGTAIASEQIPYAISGGLIGISLVILGSALVIRFSLARLFRYWLARIVYEHQVQTDRTVDALGRIEAILADGSGGSPSGWVPPAGPDRHTSSTEGVGQG